MHLPPFAGLRATDHKQIEAIAEVPLLLHRHPSPVAVNSLLLKLAHVFRDGYRNFILLSSRLSISIYLSRSPVL